MSDHSHFKLYKPYGYISQMLSNDERQARKKKFLRSLYDFPKGIMAIGRLDEKSEGLLLLTTDGKLSDTINRSGIEKEYYAQVDGMITQEAIEALSKGVQIGFNGKKYLTKPCIVSKLTTVPDLPERSKKLRDDRHGPTTWIRVVIREGKFRQVRKMTSAVGYPTLRLVRIRVGNITLGELQPSEVEKITTTTIASQIIAINSL
ncbi:pseudouridine synthase [uncultured Dokdonia sp.]|uniref:pseudouridine synthase n=1 Tax=uncultured Dokdonia sp. TaxID=575653 RepID=UPI00260D6C96|nr:pseudouridine synthase [uncultured Dokdonia sp.]